jgi:hypothetical protein
LGLNILILKINYLDLIIVQVQPSMNNIFSKGIKH